MRIAVLGAGRVGSTLGQKWAAAGHEVVFGVRDISSPKVRAILESVQGPASADTLAGAIAFGEIVVFAIPGTAVASTVDAYAPTLDGQILVDATNRFGSPEVSSVTTFAAKTPRARLFRAFNSLGWECFVEPSSGNLQADLLYCGPDD